MVLIRPPTKQSNGRDRLAGSTQHGMKLNIVPRVSTNSPFRLIAVTPDRDGGHPTADRGHGLWRSGRDRHPGR